MVSEHRHDGLNGTDPLEVFRLRSKVQDLEDRLHAAEQRFRAGEQMSKTAEQKHEAALAAAQEEILRASQARNDAEERARRSDVRVSGLLAESQQAASYMSAVAGRYDHQAEVVTILQRRLESSEAEAKTLRAELVEILQGEAERMDQLVLVEAKAAALVPELTNELKAEAASRAALSMQARELRDRLHVAEQQHTAHSRDLEAEVNQARHEKAALGRKCAESYQAVALHANAGQHWQQRSRAAELELIRACQNSQMYFESAQRQREEALRARELNRDVESQQRSAKQSNSNQDLRSWVLSSLNEVSRSAHAHGNSHSAADSGFAGRAWVDMLESFRKNEQTRAGFGNRTRAAV